MKDLRQLASNLTREEKFKYISSDLSEAERNEMADKLTLIEVQFIDGMKAAIKEDLGEIK
jgi:predicted secreted protein